MMNTAVLNKTPVLASDSFPAGLVESIKTERLLNSVKEDYFSLRDISDFSQFLCMSGFCNVKEIQSFWSDSAGNIQAMHKSLSDTFENIFQGFDISYFEPASDEHDPHVVGRYIATKRSIQVLPKEASLKDLNENEISFVEAVFQYANAYDSPFFPLSNIVFHFSDNPLCLISHVFEGEDVHHGDSFEEVEKSLLKFFEENRGILQEEAEANEVFENFLENANLNEGNFIDYWKEIVHAVDFVQGISRGKITSAKQSLYKVRKLCSPDLLSPLFYDHAKSVLKLILMEERLSYLTKRGFLSIFDENGYEADSYYSGAHFSLNDATTDLMAWEFLENEENGWLLYGLFKVKNKNDLKLASYFYENAGVFL